MADGACDKHGALIELAATWCEAQGRAKLDPMAPIWERRAKMLREGYKPQLVSAPSATVATLNMNDTVRVKLNQRGLDIMKANHDNLYDVVRKNGGAGREWSPPKLDSEGFYSTQLWCLMQEFGAHIRLGFDVPFETEIRLDKCAVTERGTTYHLTEKP